MRYLVIFSISLILGCSEKNIASVPTFAVRVGGSVVAAPDSVRSGWVNLRVEEDGGGHILVAFRMPNGSTSADIPRFIQALDTARTTPNGALAIGGPEAGDTSEVIVHFRSGLYVLACLRRENGQRHSSRGEARPVVAFGPQDEPPLPIDSAVAVSMKDFVYHTDAPWQSSSRYIKVTNGGHQDHQMRIDKLRDGVTFQAWLEAEDASTISQTVSGVARTSPGETVYLPTHFGPGVYVLYCLIPDAGSGRIHAELGMIRAVTVR